MKIAIEITKCKTCPCLMQATTKIDTTINICRAFDKVLVNECRNGITVEPLRCKECEEATL